MEIVEPYRYRAVAPRVVQLVAAIRREQQIDPERRGRVVERPQLIAGRMREDQYPCHRYIRATCSVLGSAQQYQGSFRYGTAARDSSGGRDGGTMPAASCAISHTCAKTSSRGALSREPTSRSSACCSTSTRASGWRHRCASDAALKPVTSARTSGSSSIREPSGMSSRIAY